MTRSILVPLDGSGFAEHALPYAVGIARRTRATIHVALVHVPLDVAGPGYPLSDALETQDREVRDLDTAYVADMVRRLEEAGVSAVPVLLSGRIAPTLARYVEERRIGLVVMTTHGRGGLQRAWLGSTADGIIRRGTVPVLLVRPSDSTRDISLTTGRAFHTVVAALDGGETSEMALKGALELGLADGARLVLARVFQPPIATLSPYMPHTAQLTIEEIEARKRYVGRYLEEIAAEEWMSDRPAERRVLVEQQPAFGILALAEEVHADLIVLGTHGRGGLRRMVLGSVADKVVRGTDRPVLVHRGTGVLREIASHTSRRYAAAVPPG